MPAFNRNLFTFDGKRMIFNVSSCKDADELRRYIKFGGGCVNSTNEEEPYTITLVDSDLDAEWAKDTFLSSFILKCGLENMILSLEKFWVKKSGRFNNKFHPNDILQRKITWSEAVRKFSVIQNKREGCFISNSSCLNGLNPVIVLERCDIVQNNRPPFKSESDQDNISVRLTGEVGPDTSRPRSRKRNEYTEEERKQMVAYIVENNCYGQLRQNEIWQQMEKKFPRHTWQSLKEHFRKQIMPKISHFDLTQELITKLRYGMNELQVLISSSNDSENNSKPVKLKRQVLPKLKNDDQVSSSEDDSEPFKFKKSRKQGPPKLREDDQASSDSSVCHRRSESEEDSEPLKFRKLRERGPLNASSDSSVCYSKSESEDDSEPFKFRKLRKRGPPKLMEDDQVSDNSSVYHSKLHRVYRRKLRPRRLQRQICSEFDEDESLQMISSDSHDDSQAIESDEDKLSLLENILLSKKNKAIAYEWVEDYVPSILQDLRTESGRPEKDDLIDSCKNRTTEGNASFDSSCSEQSHSSFPIKRCRTIKSNSLTRDLNLRTPRKCNQPSQFESVPVVFVEKTGQEQNDVEENCEPNGDLSFVLDSESEEEVSTNMSSDWSDGGKHWQGSFGKRHKQHVSTEENTVAEISCPSPVDVCLPSEFLPVPESFQAENADDSAESFSLQYRSDTPPSSKRGNLESTSSYENSKNFCAQFDFRPTDDASIQTDFVIVLPLPVGSESNPTESKETPHVTTSAPPQPQKPPSSPSCFAGESKLVGNQSRNGRYSVKRGHSESSSHSFSAELTDVILPTPSDCSLKEVGESSASPSKPKKKVSFDIDQSRDVTTRLNKKLDEESKVPVQVQARANLSRRVSESDHSDLNVNSSPGRLTRSRAKPVPVQVQARANLSRRVSESEHSDLNVNSSPGRLTRSRAKQERRQTHSSANHI